MSDGSYPDEEDRKAEREYSDRCQKNYREHRQPCNCLDCVTVRYDREWRNNA